MCAYIYTHASTLFFLLLRLRHISISFAFGQHVCRLSHADEILASRYVNWTCLQRAEKGNIGFLLAVLLAMLVLGQTARLDHRSPATTNTPDDEDEDFGAIDSNRELQDQFKSLTSEQLAELDEFLSRKLDDESGSISSSEVLHRNTRRPHQKSIVKRDALWTTTEVLNCIRGLKHFKNSGKLDVATEMLNCYRRLKHSG